MSGPDEYFARARSWADDTRAGNDRSRRAAWTIAGIAVAVALFEAVALAMLAPLKTVQPITLLVDKQTGYVQALDPLTPRRVTADDALTTSLLAQYVTAREEFDRATVAADYRRVALWSAGRSRQAYLAQMPATNPASPFQRYPAGTTVLTRIKSVSRLQDGVALVRFDTQLEDRSGRVDPPQPWLSVLRYHYVDAPMRFDDRLVNPLGFQVVDYRRDAEAPPPVAAQPLAVPLVMAAPAVAPAPAATVPPVSPARYRLRAAPTSKRPRQVTIAGVSEPVPPAADRREVPIQSLPLGSPLSPVNAPIRLVAAGAPR